MNTSLAITISPPMRTHGKYSNPHKMYFLDDCIQISAILRYNRITKFIIYPEFDSKGRLHYHGILNLDTNQFVRFHKHAIHKLRNIGFVDIKKLMSFMDKLRWIIYIKKEWGITSNILEIETPVMFIGKKQLIKNHSDLMELERRRTLLDYFKD